MAQCSKCGKEVGCGCNLTNGLCAICYTTGLQQLKKCSRIILTIALIVLI